MSEINQEVNTCPKCGSDNLNYGSIDVVDGDSVYFPVECQECGLQYEEHHALTFKENYIP